MLRDRFRQLLWLLLAGLPTLAFAQQDFNVELRNGLRFGPCVVSETDSINFNAFERAGGGGNVPSKSILIFDDGLRLTFVNKANVLASRPSTVPANEQIELPSAAEAARAGEIAIMGILGVSQFNKYGRRTYSLLTNRGSVDVLQGITLLTPTFAKVEVLRTGTEEFAWDQRIATSSILNLREILYQAMDLNKSNDWLRIVSFYTQAGRFIEAREVMTEALTRFPVELADRAAVLTQLDQLLANQKFEEIKLRRRSGQPQLATGLLGAFPVQALSLENQLKLNDELEAVKQQVLVVSDIAKALREQVAKLPEPEQQVIQPVVDTILDEVNLESVVRLADFQRLRQDASIPTENLLAYAIGGWLLGPGAGIDNFIVAKSLVRVQGLVNEYLADASPPRRDEILLQLQSEEGARPELLAKMLAVMKPPLPLPEPAGQVTGMFRGQVETPAGGTVQYVVQVPPEYDPNRKYPCVLALPGKGEPAELEIDYWCGLNAQLNTGEYRFGQATRYGYIVVSPLWMTDGQSQYNYTEGEHARILSCLRDAYRRFSINTDRVFISGHFDGATAAWDIAVAHPDLWAGAIMISPGADKYIVHYDENIRGNAKSSDPIPLGTYIVYGQYDGTRSTSKLGTVGTRYLTSYSFDSVVVEYRGQGRVRFAAELPRIMEWMELSSHRRVRTPQQIDTRSMRSGDRFFYWLEAPALLPVATGNSYQFDPSSYGKFEARRLDAEFNGVTINKIPSVNRGAIVWLTPQMVDFGRTINVTLSGRRSRHDLSPDIAVMLEDVRQRADRQHVFWQKIVL